MKATLALLLALPAFSAVTNPDVRGVTPQQATLAFTVPDASLCTLTVYSDAALTVKVDDTNNAIFAGSENCVRPYNLPDNTRVTAVLGRRTSSVALDGVLHSRSLAVATPYWAKITDTLNASTTTVAFTTANLPWGDTHPELPGFNAAGFGNWAYPELDWTDAGVSKWYVDPTSGLQFRRIPRTEIGGGGDNDFHPYFHYTAAGVFDVTKEQTTVAKWTNLQNGLNTSTAGPFTSYSGTTRDPLFFAVDRVGVNTPYNVWYAQDDLAINLYGSAPGCTGDDCKVTVCLAAKYNPLTDLCTGPELDVTLPTSAGQVDFPSAANYPKYQFPGWSVGRALRTEEWGVWGSRNSFVEGGNPAGGTLASSAGTLYIGHDGDTLLPSWAASGMKFWLGGNWYTLGLPTSASAFPIQEAGISKTGNLSLTACTRTSNVVVCTPTTTPQMSVGDLVITSYSGPFDGLHTVTAVTGTTFSFASVGTDTTNGGGFARMQWMLGNFGVRVRKKTATSNTINLAATFNIADVRQPRISTGSEHPWCSNVDFPLSVAADGVTAIPTKRARLCRVGEYADITQLLLVADDGEIRYISALKGSGTPTVPFATFSATDAFTQYASGSDAGYQALFSAVYNPALGCNYKTWTGNDYATVTPPGDCVVYTNLTPSGSAHTVTQQIATALPSEAIWDPTWTDHTCDINAPSTGVGANCFNGLTAIVGDYAWYSAGGQDGVIWQAAFNMITGNLVKIINTFSGTLQNLRWSGQHSGGGNDGVKWIEFDAKALYGAGWTYLTGPWVSNPAGGIIGKSTDGITYTSNTTLTPNSPYGWTCAANSQGITGAQCVWLHVSSDEMCNINSSAVLSSETTRWPCSWHAGWTSGPLRLSVDDFFSTYNGSIDGKAEKMRVLTKVSDGSGGWKMMLQRHATCDNPTGDLNGTPPGILYFRAVDGQSTWGDGLNPTNPVQFVMMPSYSCDGMIAWADSSVDLAHTVMPPPVNLAFQHGSGGVGPNGTDTTEGGTGIFRTAPFAVLPGTSAHTTQNYVDVPWAGIGNGNSTDVMEIYTAVTNLNAPTKLTRSLALDAHHMNPGGGSYPEKGGIYLYTQTYTPVGGTSYVYKLDALQMLGTAADQKTRRPVTTATNTSWQDISSANTGNQITDATVSASCYAYKVNECRSGSAIGDYYVWAKNPWMTLGGCAISNLKTYSPCTFVPWPQSGWITQSSTQVNDLQGTHIRRLSLGMVGPMSWYQFSDPHPTPDHKFMFVRSSYINGVNDRPIMYKLPPPGTDDSVDRSRFIPTTVALPAAAGYARVKFGYAENGPTSSFYCTSRQEACYVDALATPFSFETTDAANLLDCSSGCWPAIPALPGRMLYYRVERSTDGTTWTAGPTLVKAIQ